MGIYKSDNAEIKYNYFRYISNEVNLKSTPTIITYKLMFSIDFIKICDENSDN